jgi:branched-chain amino acid transport system substrate-binding protein
MGGKTMDKPKGGVSRRDVLKGGSALAGIAATTTITGFPNIANAEANTIRIGMPTILSGRVAILGESSRNAVKLAVKRFNDAGGVNGRKIEMVFRDSKGKPDEAARITRDLVNSDGCEIIIDGEASSGAFAVHEVIRELPVLCLHTNSETSKLTADPKLHLPTAFRCARQGVHDAIAGGGYAGKLAKEKGLVRWMVCSPDYVYGHDNSAQFLEYLKLYEPKIEVVDQAWPKLFEPDYTAYVTRILKAAPDALYSCLWGGDLVSFIEQGNLYGLFSGKTTFFSANLADPPIVKAIKQVPDGMRSCYRYDPNYPGTEANHDFDKSYVDMAGQDPTNWAWQNYTAAQFVTEALKRTAGKTDGKALAGELEGMAVDSPFSKTGKITMRGSDHTIIHYPVAWGSSRSKPRGFTDWVAGNWNEILEKETAWKKSKGYI